MRLATDLAEIHARGADLAALSVDAPGRNAAMALRWGLPFPIHSDPGGERFLRPLGLWDAGTRGGVGVPALIVVDGAGDEAWRAVSRDFVDRPGNEELLAALDGLAAAPLAPPPEPWRPAVEPDEHDGAFRTDALGAYLRGVASSTGALARRLDGAAAQEAARTSAMARSFNEAWRAHRATLA